MNHGFVTRSRPPGAGGSGGVDPQVTAAEVLSRLAEEHRRLVARLRRELRAARRREEELGRRVSALEERLSALEGRAAEVPPAPARARPWALGARHREVLALAEEGQPPQAIASATGRGVGEVDLVLRLARRAAGRKEASEG
jgi:septal ring factor EnvC (AmiA/AmiB activator)